MTRLMMMLMVTFFTGCASSNFTHMQPLMYQFEPSIKVQKDPESHIDSYQTFSLIPASSISKDSNMGKIEEKQILFFLRGLFEAKGYKYVKLDGSPDFIATISVSSQYKENYVPPQTVTVPMWVPSQTITSKSYSSGTASAYGSGGYAYGNYSGNSTTESTVPGYMTSETYTKPGYNIGFHYPTVNVVVLDANSNALVWSGAGTATSKTSDMRISSQLLSSNMLKSFPLKSLSEIEKNEIINKGKIGMAILPMTFDGNDYYPVVTQLVKRSPAILKGIKRWDIIVRIDGQSTKNISLSNAYNSLSGKPGDIKSLQVFRDGKQMNFDITMGTHQEVYGNQ